MPQFLRIITGDAKAATNGPANARAAWTLHRLRRTGPPRSTRCARGAARCSGSWTSRAAGTARTPTAPTTAPTWSSRTRPGACPAGTVAIPQLRMLLHLRGARRTPLRAGQLPRAAAQPGHRPRRLRQRHAGRLMAARWSASTAAAAARFPWTRNRLKVGGVVHPSRMFRGHQLGMDPARGRRGCGARSGPARRLGADPELMPGWQRSQASSPGGSPGRTAPPTGRSRGMRTAPTAGRASRAQPGSDPRPPETSGAR